MTSDGLKFVVAKFPQYDTFSKWQSAALYTHKKSCHNLSIKEGLSFFEKWYFLLDKISHKFYQ